MIFQKYQIASIRKIGENTNAYRLKPLQKKIAFSAGEFIMLHILDKNTSQVKRSYSVASSPDNDEIELCIKLVDGELTSRLAKLHEGEVVGIHKGGGHFTYNGEKKCGFIAGGTGIAPIMGMLRTIAGRKIQGKFVFFCSARTKSSILYEKELKELQKENPGIKVIQTLTREKWTGESGRVDAEMIKRHVGNPSEFSWWICGPLAMIKSMREHLASLGTDPKKIKMEGWG
ncbi:FAD-dependent oxidoreductase [Candidatus Micrarchaeota archaeon]|nr:FAD-dependent oxidoreductase [Candidatus Micrarchaeota archaeon]